MSLDPNSYDYVLVSCCDDHVLVSCCDDCPAKATYGENYDQHVCRFTNRGWVNSGDCEGIQPWCPIKDHSIMVSLDTNH